MKTLVALVAFCFALTPAVQAKDIKIGVIFGFTGPIESLTPPMADGVDMAFKEASGKVLDGDTLVSVRADSTCVDAAAATTAAERLVTSDSVAAIIGADCSGVTIAITNNVAVPNGVTIISPSATSPALSTIKDNDLFFRTSPSDARQGEGLAGVLKKRGVNSVAVTYTNNDYGKGLAESFGNAYKAMGGKVEIQAAHEDGKGDYGAEVGALAASGAEYLAVFGYLDQGGKGIIQTALDRGAFDKFILADGMIGESLTKSIGEDLNGAFGTVPGSDSPGAKKFEELAKSMGVKSGPFVGESYDAAALVALAIQAAKSSKRGDIQSKIMSVANAPGEKIMPGELAKGLKILASGGEVDYVGATDVELNKVGEVSGVYREVEVKNQKFETVTYHR